MTIAFWCVLVMIFLPYFTVGIAKWKRGFDNNNPRDWLAHQEGHRKRAHAAHLNHFESMPGFFVAVLIAHYLKAPQPWVDALAVLFIACRIGFTWAYIKDLATLRSAIWTVGLGSVAGLILVAAFAGAR
jgi:uncharacterized MAPEG superfamily protein